MALADKGLSNYWGYNTYGFFAPERSYSAARAGDAAVQDFKRMVRAFHAADIEVILDVVYNHTAEGNQLGPTLSLRGIDNAFYYRLSPKEPRYYMDYTGCGNGLNMRNPAVLRLVMDSLRYWVAEMHVDGFRFDLASALARELHEVDKLGAFFDIIHQDPVLSQAKLIAEPWDLGEGGYQVGNFPIGWTEWNGKYRDVVRRFWKGEGGGVGELATRLTGSSDLYAQSGRRPYASINFITCHDGFTLHDLVSYNQKHNEANKEDNKDGTDDNMSWNCGAEGPTDDPVVKALRERQKRNMIATLLFSEGVPMLCGGDEAGRTQSGNNNAYCQDNEISWLHWDLTADQKKFREFVRRVIALRMEHPVFKRRKFFQGRALRGSGVKDISFFEPNGEEMADAAWNSAFVKCLGIRLAGDALGGIDVKGEPDRRRHDALAPERASREDRFYSPGDASWIRRGSCIWTTADPETAARAHPAGRPRATIFMERSLALLRAVKAGDDAKWGRPWRAVARRLHRSRTASISRSERRAQNARAPRSNAEEACGVDARSSAPATVISSANVPDVRRGGRRVPLSHRRKGTLLYPDPASRFQRSTGVHGPSLIVDPGAFSLDRRRNWNGVRPRELAFYELHLGTFTA